MDQLAKICSQDDLLLATYYKVIDVTDPASTQDGFDWWLQLTGEGGEGMVVKPLDRIAKGNRGLTPFELFNGYTYSGHPLACAAGLATLDINEEEQLFARAALV